MTDKLRGKGTVAIDYVIWESGRVDYSTLVDRVLRGGGRGRP